MTTSLLYCPVCGAANTLDQSICFACQQSLVLYDTDKQPVALVQNRYQIVAALGTGGFGAVYKARDTQNQGRFVAIKQINLKGLTPREMIDATDGFNREVQILSKLSHAHLPRIHTHFTDPEHWYVVMDFIEGETLEVYVQERPASPGGTIRALPLDEVLDIGLQLCSVLAYLHTRQPPVIFRDLKPANLIRTPHGQLYLIDFGIARYFKPGQSKDTAPLGSPGYAAPEQYGRAQTDPRADIYSLGALLHALLSRRDPAETPFVFTPLHHPGISGSYELHTLVMRMVEGEAGKRPASVLEVEVALNTIRSRTGAGGRIWQPMPGQTPPAPGSPQMIQLQQHIKGMNATTQPQATVTPKKKSRRTFLKTGLVTAGTLFAGGTIGGFSYWKYWHPARLTQEWSFPGQSLLPENAAPTTVASTVAWSASGQYVAFGLNNGNLAVFHHTSAAMSMLFETQAPAQALPSKVLAWSPDDRFLAATAINTIEIWDALSPQEMFIIGNTKGNIQALAWSPDHQQIATVDDQGGLYVYYISGKQMIIHIPLWTGTDALAWSPDGAYLATRLPTTPSYQSTLQIWDVRTGQQITSQELGTPGLTALAWAPDSQSLATLGADGTLQVWNDLRAEEPDRQAVFAQAINTQQTQLAWSPDQHFLAAIDDAANLLVLDRSNGSTLVSASLLNNMGMGGVFPGKALTWLPDSQHIAVASNDLTCQLWTLSWF